MRRNVISIRGDGNCLFRSIAHCVYGTQERHREVRSLVVDKVVDEWSRYKNFVIGDPTYGRVQGPGDYRSVMSRDGAFGGYVELHCASEIYSNYTFMVHTNFTSRSLDFGCGRVVRHLLFTGFFDAGHYSVLE